MTHICPLCEPYGLDLACVSILPRRWLYAFMGSVALCAFFNVVSILLSNICFIHPAKNPNIRKNESRKCEQGLLTLRRPPIVGYWPRLRRRRTLTSFSLLTFSLGSKMQISHPIPQATSSQYKFTSISVDFLPSDSLFLEYRRISPPSVHHTTLWRWCTCTSQSYPWLRARQTDWEVVLPIISTCPSGCSSTLSSLPAATAKPEKPIPFARISNDSTSTG